MRIERRLKQPRWLIVVVPAGSLVFAFFASGIVLQSTGHDALSSYRKIIDAAFLSNGAIGQTLISATPLAFTGLAAAAAFRMRLFNIGGEGQLYIGAITAAAAGLYLGGSGGASPFVIAAMVVAGCAGGAAWALIPGILRAFFKTNEIITSLMLNYVAAYLLTYLIFNSESYWRQTKGFNATVFPTGKPLPDSAVWPAATIHAQGGIMLPLGAGLAVLAAVVLWVLYSRTRFGFEVQVLGDSPRAARYAGNANAPQDPRGDGDLRRDRRPRRREPGRRLPAHARRRPERAAEAVLRLHGDRRRGARRATTRSPSSWSRS